jgi:hypothetical protein
MFSRICVTASIGVALFAADAAATTAVPILSGTYVLTHSAFCQPTVLVNYANGAPSLINLNGPGVNGGWGGVRFEAGTGVFNATKMMVTYSATHIDGTPILLQSEGGGPNNLEGSSLTQSPSTGKASYATTATTVTLAGNTYNAAYGTIRSGGIVQHVSFVGIDSSGCANLFALDRK